MHFLVLDNFDFPRKLQSFVKIEFLDQNLTFRIVCFTTTGIEMQEIFFYSTFIRGMTLGFFSHCYAKLASQLLIFSSPIVTVTKVKRINEATLSTVSIIRPLLCGSKKHDIPIYFVKKTFIRATLTII